MEKLKRELIKKYLEDWQEPTNESIKSLLQTGKVSGSLFTAIKEMMDEYAERKCSNNITNSLPTKDEAISEGYGIADNSDYKYRRVLRDKENDLYYSGWMDCFDWILKNNNVENKELLQGELGDVMAPPCAGKSMAPVKKDNEFKKLFTTEEIKTEIELLILNNEDDFDRGQGKYILKEWIEDFL